MAPKLPPTTAAMLSRRSCSLASSTSGSFSPSLPHRGQHQQVRHATFVPRHRRPYQFTQLVQLSDGSTFTVRTTSPQALYRSAKDSRNHILWQPSDKSLRNVEVDEAGKLAAFRERFGRGWDMAEGPAAAAAASDAAAGAAAEEPAKDGKKNKVVDGKAPEGKKGAQAQAQAASPAAAPAAPAAEEKVVDPFDSLVDLISGYATEDKNIKGGLSAKDQARKDKAKKK